ncbi:MAG TPA: CHAT domain-containing protein [Pyrinomonadaceae bacterium]|nr:CHAT domain-containing protein [Pyrinomonadaceae bacterium]
MNTLNKERTHLIIRSVQRGVRWLKEHSEVMPGALEDPRDIGITISALVAAERNPHSHVVQRLVSDLLKRRNKNGSWNDEVYDTFFAVRALSDVGFSSNDQMLSEAFRFLQATQDPIDGTWYEEPYDTLLALDLIARLAPDQLEIFTDRPVRWIESLQKDDGSIIGARHTGMVASLFCLTNKARLTNNKRVVDRAIEYLRRELQEKPIWTAAAWSNYYPLQALLDSGYDLDDPLVIKAVDWFLAAQDVEGKWLQVSRVHDTAMSVLVLSSLLTAPLVDLTNPRTGVLYVFSENGTLRVTFQRPGAGAMAAGYQIKISPQARADLSNNKQFIDAALGQLRDIRETASSHRSVPQLSIQSELEKTGRLAYGRLLPGSIQVQIKDSRADHLRLDMDEKLIALPWELLHDGSQFLCLRYALGRRLVSDQEFASSHRYIQTAEHTRALIVADPTKDLPAAQREGREVAKLLRDQCGMHVEEFTSNGMTKNDFLLCLKDYDIVHFAGHASHGSNSPDESCMRLSDGDIPAYEISRFLTSGAPSVVFLNACWSAEELSNPDSYSPMMRGLGRTFLYAGVTAFLGYLVPVPDLSATHFAIYFYEALAQGQTIGESLRRARLQSRNLNSPSDTTWSSAILYGDPAARAVEVPDVV